VPRLGICPQCQGAGAIGFETGPAAEPCTGCQGTGRTYPEPQWRGLFREMINEKGVLLDPEWRLLLEGLVALEERVATLEAAGSLDEL
jgi:hypothetical protein